MSLPYRYDRVGQDLLEELLTLIERGENVLLMGPRYSGKRYLVARLLERAGERLPHETVELRFLPSGPEDARRLVWGQFARKLGKTGNRSWKQDALEADLAGEIGRYLRESQSALLLTVANVDALPLRLARRFLHGLHALVDRSQLDRGQFVVVLTAETDPDELVHGETSEFNCSTRIVLQGFEEKEFGRFVEEYTSPLNLGRLPKKRLFEITGGNIYLLRALIWDFVEARRAIGKPLTAAMKAGELKSPWAELGVFWTWQDKFLADSLARVKADRQLSHALIQLVQEGSIPLTHNAPHGLELAGVAVRNDGVLSFSSPLMESFLCAHYDERRMGHLLAGHQQWDEAFAHYAEAPAEAMLVTGADQTRELYSAVSALCIGLEAAVPEGPDKVRELFANGAKHLLGMPNVAFWRLRGRWKRIVGSGDDPLAEDVEEQCRQILDTAGQGDLGMISLAGDLSDWAILVDLPSEHPAEIHACILGDFERHRPITRRRRETIEGLVDAFVSALEHACAGSRQRARLEVRDKHIEIIGNIVDALGRQVKGVEDVLRAAARELRKLGYRRVTFCLVDAERKRIVGVLDDSDGPVDTAAMTDYALDDPEQDVQPHVVHTKEPIRIADAAKHRWTNKKVVEAAGIKGMALIPLISHGEVIGTIHVERDDREEPTAEEVADLQVFARQLAVAVEEGERVGMLLSALDQLREPLAILDRQEYIRYTNRPGADFLRCEPGWQGEQVLASSKRALSGEPMQVFHKAIAENQRLVRHMACNAVAPGARIALTCTPLLDSRDQTLGAALHVRDLTSLRGLFEAFELAGAAKGRDSLLKALLKGTEALGHKWGRLYLIDDSGDAERLVGYAQYGLRGRDARKFERGEVQLARSSEPPNESWNCIDEKTPKVYCWLEELEDGEEFTTPHGLTVLNVKNSHCPPPVRKKPEDYWIDFPLFARERGVAMGKITLECNETMDPGDFELLRVFAEIASALIEATLEHDQFQKKQLLRRAANRAIAETSHHISGRLSALPLLLSRYQRLEGNDSKLAEIDRDFVNILSSLKEDIERTAECLGPMRITMRRVDLAAVMECILRQALDSDQEFKPSVRPLVTDVDPKHLERVMLELMQNSREAAADKKAPHICVELTTYKRGKAEYVQIRYQDSGPGVPDQFKQRIFEEFFSRRLAGPGSGLGLAFVRRIVEGHRGCIRECGKVGQGAEFVIEFPRYSHSGMEEV